MDVNRIMFIIAMVAALILYVSDAILNQKFNQDFTMMLLLGNAILYKIDMKE